MGYRSDVKVLIDIPCRKASDVAKEIARKTEHKSEYSKDVYQLFDKFLVDKKENILILEAIDTKWYEDFDEVKEFYDWLAETSDKFDKGMEGGIHFLRIGESYDDVEEIVYGDPKEYLQLYRDIEIPENRSTIIYDFKEVDVEEKEPEKDTNKEEVEL